MRVLAILPDTTHAPMGGVGEQALQLYAKMPEVALLGTESHNGQYEHGVGIRASLNCNYGIIAAALKMPAPDLIHCTDWSTTLAGRVLADAYDVPLVMTQQLSFSWLISQGFYTPSIDTNEAEEIELQGMVAADHVIHVSNEYANAYRPINPFASVIRNGINLADWQHPGPVSLPGTRRRKIAYIGRYAEIKNIPAMLGARLPDDVDFYFIGSPRGGEDHLFDSMRAKCESSDQHHYLGPKYGQDKRDTLSAMEAVIVPSTHEPFGIVCLEALAAGCKLLSSFASGMGEYLDDAVALHCGISGESISGALHASSDWHPDADRVQRLLAAMNWEVPKEQVRAIYKNLIAAKTQRLK